jgi:putative ABC transport system ATP-binding protein
MIEILNLYKSFKDTEVLKGINLSIKKGEVTLLKGISGSGKSTLLSIIATLAKPTTGEVYIDDVLVSKLPDHHISSFRLEHIGFTPQDFKLIESLNAFENCQIPLIPLGFSPTIIEEKVKEALKQAGISHKADLNVKDLSGGERQRVAIARSLVNSAKIVLFDEPTANLDRKNSQNFISLMQELKSKEKTIIIATHDPIFEECSLIDKVINIEDGMIV